MNENQKTALMSIYFMCTDSGEKFEDVFEHQLIEPEDIERFTDKQLSRKYALALLEELKPEGYVDSAHDLWPYVINGFYLTDKAYDWIVGEDDDTWYKRLYEQEVESND